jgi:uncharacterized protein YwgA
MKLSKPELIAALLYVPGKTGHIGEPIVGRTRLMKLVFLLLKEGGLAEDVDKATTFKPYRYGPFDPEVFDCIEALKELNIVEEKATPQSKIGDEMLEDIDETYDTETTYRLTPQGIAKVERIVRQLPANVLRIISNYKSIYGDKPLIEILHYVYGKYPKYAELSEANI